MKIFNVDCGPTLTTKDRWAGNSKNSGADRPPEGIETTINRPHNHSVSLSLPKRMFLMSLARPAKHAVRGNASNLLSGARPHSLWRRNLITIHNAKGKFVTIDDFGALVSKEVTISRGGEDESFVMVEREVGLAIESAIVRQIGVSLTKDPEAIPVKFYHKSLHFAHGMSIFIGGIT